MKRRSYHNYVGRIWNEYENIYKERNLQHIYWKYMTHKNSIIFIVLINKP